MDAAFVTGTTQLSTSRSGSRTSSSTLNSREPPSHRIRMPDRLSPALRAMLAASPPPCGCSVRPYAGHHRDSHLYQLVLSCRRSPSAIWRKFTYAASPLRRTCQGVHGGSAPNCAARLPARRARDLRILAGAALPIAALGYAVWSPLSEGNGAYGRKGVDLIMGTCCSLIGSAKAPGPSAGRLP